MLLSGLQSLHKLAQIDSCEVKGKNLENLANYSEIRIFYAKQLQCVEKCI